MHDPMQMAPGLTVGDLSALDRGEYAAAITTYRSTDRSAPQDRPFHERLWLAEVALYLGDLAETRRLLGSAESTDLRSRGAEGEAVRRRQLILAEVLHFEGNSREAEVLSTPVIEAAQAAGDMFLEMRARYDLGRFARKRSEHTLAIERLAVASKLAADLGNDYYQGLITFNRAVSLYELNETAAAERRCVEAIEALTQTEDLRYRALAQNTYGALLTDLGRYADGLAALESAEQTAMALGVAGDLAAIRGNVARAMIALGRHDEAVVRLGEILTYERSTGHHYGELIALNLLSRAELVRGNLAAAERTSIEAVRLANMVGSAAERLDARLLAGRVRARLGREGAVVELREALDEAMSTGTDHQRAEALIYLADALIEESPVEAEQLLVEARHFPVVGATEWLRKELELVDQRRLEAPVHVTPEGALIVDVRLGWPQLKSARDALERFIVNRALEATDGNGAAAGRLIGETRYQMHYLKRIFERGEGRPSRATVPSDEASSGLTQRGRRSASRPKRLVRRK